MLFPKKIVIHHKFKDMKKLLCILLVLGLAFIISCKKKSKEEEETASPVPEPGTVNINGKAQKGPYKNGSPLTIFELNSGLGQTGKSFSSVISDDAGNFSLNNIALTTGYALVTANGYYYMEHFNVVSPNQLYLEALADVTGSAVVNINLLTHIIKPRIEDLVSKGSNFSSAKAQAQNEFKQIMGVSSSTVSNFENLDITNDGFLFAVSLIFQRRTSGYASNYNYTSEMNGLLSNFRNDFKNNGLIDNLEIIDTMIFNANRVQLIDVKSNFQNYYSGLGITITPPNFEPYLYAFQKQHGSPVFTSITFPDSSYFDTDMGPPSKMKNILSKSATNFQNNSGYIFAAEVPCDSSLVIKFTSYGPGYFSNFPPYYGWVASASSSSSAPLILTAQRKNFRNGFFGFLNGSGGQDSAKVEYFQNGSATPYFTKKIYW
jgi:hypothetical protein